MEIDLQKGHGLTNDRRSFVSHVTGGEFTWKHIGQDEQPGTLHLENIRKDEIKIVLQAS